MPPPVPVVTNEAGESATAPPIPMPVDEEDDEEDDDEEDDYDDDYDDDAMMI